MVSVRLAALVVLALGVASCGGSGAGSGHRAAHAHRRSAASRPPAPQPVKLTYHELYALPAPLQDPASADLGGGPLLLPPRPPAPPPPRRSKIQLRPILAGAASCSSADSTPPTPRARA